MNNVFGWKKFKLFILMPILLIVGVGVGISFSDTLGYKLVRSNVERAMIPDFKDFSESRMDKNEQIHVDWGPAATMDFPSDWIHIDNESYSDYTFYVPSDYVHIDTEEWSDYTSYVSSDKIHADIEGEDYSSIIDPYYTHYEDENSGDNTRYFPNSVVYSCGWSEKYLANGRGRAFGSVEVDFNGFGEVPIKEDCPFIPEEIVNDAEEMAVMNCENFRKKGEIFSCEKPCVKNIKLPKKCKITSSSGKVISIQHNENLGEWIYECIYRASAEAESKNKGLIRCVNV